MASEHIMIPVAKFKLWESKFKDINENAKMKDSPPEKQLEQSHPPPDHQSLEKNDADIAVKNDKPKTHQPVPEQGENDYDLTDIIGMFDRKEVKLIEPILQLMAKKDAKLTWDTKTGEIIFLNQPVTNSNIVELLKDTLVGNLHPLGKMEFLRGLDMLNVNLKFIKDPKMKRLLSVLSGKDISTPAVVKKPISKLKQSHLKNDITNEKSEAQSPNPANETKSIEPKPIEKKKKLKWLTIK